jgi:hypothetical protein
MTVNNREFTRHNFKPLMWVKIVRIYQRPDEFKMYRLIDISKSGISFMINDSQEFRRKDEFIILEIEPVVLEEPILAQVKYVSTMDDFVVDYKVGCEFISK